MSDKISYNDIINNLQQAGHKTTSIHSDKGEASFLDYGYALGDNVKDMITSSFDCDADYELQAQVASIFGNRSVMSNNDFANALRSIGLNVERFSTKTQYMIDEKNVNASGGWGSRKVVNGGISMFKISDGKGGEIIIADANGNASLEIEEVFMNQILTDIAVDVEQLKVNQNVGASASVGTSHSSSNSSKVSSSSELSILNSKETANEAEKEAEEKEQDKFNDKVESYLRNGYSLEEAESRCNLILHTEKLVYTGSLEEQIKEKETEEVA